MVSITSIFKAIKWFFIILFIDFLAYPLMLPIINLMDGSAKQPMQVALYIALGIITIAVPTLVALSSEEENE